MDHQLRIEAIRKELATAMVHRFAAAQCDDDGALALLHRLSDESIEHARELAQGDKDMFEAVERELDDSSPTESGAALGDVLNLQHGDLTSLLASSLEAERGAVRFYRNLAVNAKDEEERAELLEMVAEETQHVQLLEQFLRAQR